MPVSEKSVLILGASGRTGRLVVEKALKRGFNVSVLVRNATSFTPAKGLTIVEGTPLELNDMRSAVQASGHLQAIISTLGQTRASGSPWAAPTSPATLGTDSMRNAIAVAKEAGIPKLVVMTLCAVGESWKSNNFLIRTIFKHSNMWQTVEDGNRIDKMVKASGLQYVLVRSTVLLGTEVKPVRDLGDNGEDAGFMPSISPQSVAGFLLDAVENTCWDGRTPVISN